MLRLVLFLSILQLARGACGADYDIYRNGECRGLGADWSNNRCSGGSDFGNGCDDYCTKNGLSPLKIRNDEDQSYWAKQTNALDDWVYVWLPIYCNTMSKRWQWFDGSAVDYKPPLYDGKLDKDCKVPKNGYNDRWAMLHNGTWTPYPPKSAYDVFCTGYVPRLSIRDDGLTQNPLDGLLYQINSKEKNWKEAREDCQKQGAELVSIHNQQANSFLSQLAFAEGVPNGLFLGASVLDGNLTWSDGSDWDYANLVSDSIPNEEGDCVAMDTFSYTGQWFATDCASQLPYVCVKADPMITGPWEAGKDITSPGFPYDASIPADYLLTVPTGFVEVTIEELQANSCCDFLILSDEENGGKLVAKLTGQLLPENRDKNRYTSKTNFMKVSWRPNGAKNVKGFKLTYRSVTSQPTTSASTKAEITTLKTSPSNNIVYTTPAEQTTIQPTTTTTVPAISTSPTTTTFGQPTTTSGSVTVESALSTVLAILILASLQ